MRFIVLHEASSSSSTNFVLFQSFTFAFLYLGLAVSTEFWLFYFMVEHSGYDEQSKDVNGIRLHVFEELLSQGHDEDKEHRHDEDNDIFFNRLVIYFGGMCYGLTFMILFYFLVSCTRKVKHILLRG
jgi:hypothetical protein